MNKRYGHPDTVSNNPNDYMNRSYETARGMLENNPVIAYGLTALCFVFILLDYLGRAPISLLCLPRDFLVYIIPSRIIVAMDPCMADTEAISQGASLPFKQKKDAMMRILGGMMASTGSFSSLASLPRPQSFSNLGNALLGSTRDGAPPGLGNWNNSCFQNSVMQGLASLRSLMNFLGRNMGSAPPKGFLETHVALFNLINSLNSASNHGKRFWVPEPLDSMSSWQQQDAQEYFSKIIHQIDVEAELVSHGETTNAGLKMVGPEEHIVQGSFDDESCSEKNDMASPALGFLHNPLQGLLAQRVGCMDCGYSEGLSLIPFNCLTVPLGEKLEYDIRECLDQYMTLEPIEGVECAKCTLLHKKEQLTNLLDGLGDENRSQSTSSETPQPLEGVRLSALSRLEEVNHALENKDFSENTLAQKCHIPSRDRVNTTKSRQAVIARAPQCVAIHINRSLFDEMTGMLRKNYASVRFPPTIDLNSWCLGTRAAGESGDILEEWETNPSKSMIPQLGESIEISSRLYELRAVITHYGRHENGHYICYRKYPTSEFTAPPPDEILQAEGDQDKPERWWRLSDDDVEMVSEGHVMSQGGAFMLFYEAIDESTQLRSQSPSTEEYLSLTSGDDDPLEMSKIPADSLMEDISASSTVTDFESSTRATSISMPSEEAPRNLLHTKEQTVCDAYLPPKDDTESHPATAI
ncbi:unnamed protein product [Penicillium salamii]|uniref:ubiquitinyl hydrolase 1 n=1 Tax=Penicillium salamii TaxID=1612424 RepID=A0A9W4NDL8_9EURO|nr:unnamed protein product [Penicillium salamii]CAG8046787.1 unnamed protein product [Penicillium salamii]CAG8336422.1 unnamed protein product [Penicillium salamii]CAG8348326.1 unnamed protein product [Penicillium salamii]CAG8348381.1 unnamed protein product [Penicillium salamii]